MLGLLTAMLSLAPQRMEVGRRSVLLGIAANAAPSPAVAGYNPNYFMPAQLHNSAAPGSWSGPAKAALASSSVFGVMTDGSDEAGIVKMHPQRAFKSFSTSRALFLGEHHDSASDHVLQAAIITELKERRRTGAPLAVGLEAVQRQFQPALDAYTQGQISSDQLRVETQWDSRWAWPFSRYVPVLHAAKEAGARLVALNVDSEDLRVVQEGGFPGLGRRRMGKYITDPEGFGEFASTAAFKQYVDYVIRPSYVLHGQLGLLRRERPAELASATRPARPAYAFNMTFSNFLSARLLWDEAMGNGASSWLAANPGGLMVALLGNDHVKFGCGAAARCARSIGGVEPVRTVMINPRSGDTSRQTDFRRPELPLTALQLPFASSRDRSGPARSALGTRLLAKRRATPADAERLRTACARAVVVSDACAAIDKRDAHSQAQARRGQSVLPLADFLWFSHSLTAGSVVATRKGQNFA